MFLSVLRNWLSVAFYFSIGTNSIGHLLFYIGNYYFLSVNLNKNIGRLLPPIFYIEIAPIDAI